MARGEQPYAGDERSLLEQWLEFQRETLAIKCAGLTPEQLAEQSDPPSTVSLARLVRHLADMERMDRQILEGEEPASMYEEPASADDAPGEETQESMYDWGLYDVSDDALAVWRRECDAVRAAVARYGSLDDHVPGAYSVLTVRSLLMSLVMEYARHNGHADLIRQHIDGAVGY